ncbi:MAG: hypothetical protein DCC58_09240 [Chloroflexi bacterium]|nr:MAG: hypothetical protein DCC58_09240 [Chloroflexota bacterium]
MSHAIRLSVAGAIVVCGWVTIGWLIVVHDVGARGATSPIGLTAIALFIAVPYLSFLRLARHWSAPFFEIEATLGWSVFLGVLTFRQPAVSPSTFDILLFLAPLTVALAACCTAIAFATMRRAAGVEDSSFVDARRRGYMASITIIALGMLAGLGVLSLVLGLLLVTVVVLAELLIALHGRPRRGRHVNALSAPASARSGRGS